MAEKKCAKCDAEFQAPMNALWQVYDGIGSKADVVAVAWEREDGKVYRYDLPIPQRLDPKAAKFVSYVVDRIAKFIVEARKDHPIARTGELVDIIKAAIPASARREGPHPAKRTFQAIRIELNKELKILGDAIDDMIDLLGDGGRLSIITFHSLEDRIVKLRFNQAQNPCICPPNFPVCVCGRKPKGKVITRKPVLPGAEELDENSRSKSAKLRVFERSVSK